MYSQVYSKQTCWDVEPSRGCSSCQILHKEVWPSSEWDYPSLHEESLPPGSDKKASDENVDLLSHQKRGRPILLGESLGGKVQMHQRRACDGNSADCCSCCLRYSLVMRLFETVWVWWACNVEQVLGLLIVEEDELYEAKGDETTAKSKYAVTEFQRLKEEFFLDVVTTVEMEEILSELILNWDQTEIKIVPSNTWTMEEQGSKRADIAGANDKRQITAVFHGSFEGDFYQSRSSTRAKTCAAIPTTSFHLTGSSSTIPNIGQTRRLWSSMWRR